MTSENASFAWSGTDGARVATPDIHRLSSRLEQLAAIGSLPDGAQNRLPYTPADQEARELFATWATDAGLHTRMDAVGNVIVRLEGSAVDTAPVMVGSHLDTQPLGGKYDGIVGSLAALAVVESFVGSGYTPHRPIEAVVWAGEEGSGRFDVGCIGSRAMAGTLTREHLALECRMTGETLDAAMRGCGLDPDGLDKCERPPGSVHAVLELHIEQGPFLEEEGIPLGVVEAISGNRRVPLAIHGVQAHSGAQPMTHRKDALTAAAEIILMAERVAAEAAGPVVATSGMFEHHPRSIAAVPGAASVVIDVRSPDHRLLLAAESTIRARIADIGERRGVAIDLQPSWGMDPTRTDSRLVEILREACDASGEPHLLMNSGAGHDSLILGKRFPAGLLFVPSQGGLSHCPEEFTAVDDLAKGVLALQQAVLRVSAA